MIDGLRSATSILKFIIVYFHLSFECLICPAMIGINDYIQSVLKHKILIFS